MKKEKLMETLQDLPQEFDLDQLMEKLVFIDKVEKGIRQVEEGKTITHEQVKANVKEWRK